MGPTALAVGVGGVLGPVAISEAEEREDAVRARGLVDAQPGDHGGCAGLPDVQEGPGGQQVLHRLVVHLEIRNPELAGFVLQTFNLVVYFLHCEEGNAWIILNKDVRIKERYSTRLAFVRYKQVE